MGDYTPQTWVDDDGSGAVGTVYTKARMDFIEAGVNDAVKHHRIGAFSTMPAAATANKNWVWIATDTDSTGGIYLSDGVAWTKAPNPPARVGFYGDGSDAAWDAQVTPTNVLLNPGAEVNANGWNGFRTGGGALAGPTRVADAFGSGAFAFETSVTGATGAGVLIQYPGAAASFINGGVQNVVQGQVVEFSANVKAQGGAFSSIKLNSRWLDASGNLITGGEVDVPGAIQNAPVVGTGYALSGTLVAPAGAVLAGVEVIGTFGAAGTYTMRADNLSAAPIMPGTTRSGATYTLTRDVYFTDLTVDAGVTIIVAGFRIFCQGKLSGAGAIRHNGTSGGPTTGFGAGAVQGSVGPGWGGGNGGNGNVLGGGPLANAGTGHGGGGGAGGAGSGGVNTGGGPTVPTAPVGGVRRFLPDALTAFTYATVGVVQIGGGGGGGGGGGATGGTGGGGGGGGGLLVVCARAISGTLAFSAVGGSGAAGVTNGGGGGGGGGGAVHLLYGDKSGWTGTTDVSGGAGGAGNGTGVAGSAGAAGRVIQVPLN